MFTFQIQGYIKGGVSLSTIGQNSKPKAAFVVEVTQMAGTRWETKAPVKVDTTDDRVIAIVRGWKHGDYVALHGEVRCIQSKKNPEFWNPYFEMEGSPIVHIASAGSPSTQHADDFAGTGPSPIPSDIPF